MDDDFEVDDEFKPYFEDPQLTPEQIEQIKQRPSIKVQATRIAKVEVAEALDEMNHPMAVCLTCNRDIIIEEMYDEITCIECHG